MKQLVEICLSREQTEDRLLHYAETIRRTGQADRFGVQADFARWRIYLIDRLAEEAPRNRSVPR
jgi:hypothetical protein